MQDIKDFIAAVLPWVCMALALAFGMKRLSAEQARRNAAETEEERAAVERRSRNLVTGICLGECLGLALAQTFQLNIAYGLSLGMLAGVLYGSWKK